MDSTTESLIIRSGSWLDGFLEVEPVVTVGVVGVAVLGVAYFLWRRLRRRGRQRLGEKT